MGITARCTNEYNAQQQQKYKVITMHTSNYNTQLRKKMCIRTHTHTPFGLLWLCATIAAAVASTVHTVK